MATFLISPEETGKRLKKMRGDRTQEEVARAVGCTPMAVSQYEAGKRTPVDSMKVKLANYFGVSIDALFYATEVNR